MGGTVWASGSKVLGGHILTAAEIRIGNDRTRATVGSLTPKTIRELRPVLEMINFVRKGIPNLAGITALVVALAKNEAAKRIGKQWSPEHDSPGVPNSEPIAHRGARAPVPRLL